MTQKRWIEKTLAVLIMVVMVFSTLNIGTANAADQKTSTGNPVPADQNVPPALKADPADFQGVQPDQDIRVIIQLKDQSLSRYDGGVKGLQATTTKVTGQKKLDVDAAPSKTYLGYLVNKQSEFKSKISKSLPHVKIDHQYQVVLNAVSAKVKGADVEALKAMPEVAFVSIEKEHHLEMYNSIPLIGLGTNNLGYPDWVNQGLWQTLGGPQNAGKGIRIADIDSGITPDHPCFSGAGYLYPAGFPRGEKTITNGKIIAAYSYFRADDPPFYPATARDDPAVGDGGHGTHTAGTMACNYGTTVPYNNTEGNPIRISGVAPKAQLLIYRVFYESVSGSHSAWTPELVAAVEQAVKDKADVVNNSWGGTATSMYDAETVAYSAAVDAGLLMVFSAGNDGASGNSSIGSPGTGEKFITVGATTSDSMIFESTVSATSRSDGEPLDPFSVTGWGPLPADLTGELVSLDQAGYPDVIACEGPLPSNLVSGKIVLAQRGSCPFVDKASNAAAGGAIGIVVYNADGGNTNLYVIKGVIPLVTINNLDGHKLLDYLAALPPTTVLSVTLSAGKAAPDASTERDMIASFSSRGPNIDMSIKPDIMAPGVNILSSVSATELGGTPDFDFYQGTSMAAPHVTGAVALLHQLHPNWTQTQVKSALMSTASETVKSLDPQTQTTVIENNPTQRGAGRLDLTAPDKVGVTFDKPSLSYKVMAVNTTKTIEVELKNVTSHAVDYNITATDTSGTGTSPVVLVDGQAQSFVNVPVNGTVDIAVAFTPTVEGVNYGEIVFEDQVALETPTLHIPYFAKVNPALPAADVLLIDDDLSGQVVPGVPACTDYSSIYTQAITDLGMTYSLYDVVANNYYMDFAQARNYKYTIIFTGTCEKTWYTYYDLTANGNEFRNFVADGGKVILFGQDAIIWDYILQANGAQSSFMPELMFAAYPVQDNLFRNLPMPIPTMKGDNTASAFMADQVYTLQTSTDPSIDELDLVSYSDMDQLPLVRTNVLTAQSDGLLGTARFSDPSIERVQRKQMWTRLEGKNDLGETVYGRTAVYSFGLEAMDNTYSTDPIEGGNSSLGLLSRTFQFLDDQVEVGFYKEQFFGTPGSYLTLSAGSAMSYTDPNALNNLQYQNQPLSYRWDFGDGTPIQTGGPSINHKYAKLGVYKAYVEVMDGFGHRAVAGPVAVNVITAPAKPTNLAATGVTTHTPTLKWTKQAKTTSYYVEVYSYATSRTVYTSYVDAKTCAATTCSLKTPILPKGKYSFKVRAAIGDVWGLFSLPKIFTITAN